MAAKKVILCIDRGTSELKVILFDAEGRSRGMEQRKCSIVSPRPDWLEADLEETYHHLVDAVSALMDKVRQQELQVVCVAITSYMSGTIFLDEQNKAIGPAVLWNDSRTKKLVKEWEHNGVLEKNFDLSGSQILTGWPIPLLSWWKQNDRALLNRASVLLSMKDYLRFRLTGTIHTDVTEAVLSPGDVRTRAYSDEVLELFDVADYKHILPPVEEPEKIAGYLLPEVAEQMHLPVGIPVIIGLGDMPSGVLGTGALSAGHGSSVLGTTFLNGLIVDTPQPQPRCAGMTCAYVEKHMLRMVNNTGGAAINYQWFIDNFFAEEKAQLGDGEIFTYIDRLVESVEPGSNGVMYHPYINSCGVTAPFLSIGARAQFTGIGLHNTKADLLRAIYESIGFAMRDCYSSVPVELLDIMVTGGGSKSGALCQILADICQVPIRVQEEKEATALGVCISAAVGIGMYRSYSEAIAHMVRFAKVYMPRPEKKDLYDRLYELYFSIRRDMQPSWEKRRQLYSD